MAEGKPESNESKLYFDVSAKERDSAIHYLLGSIINSRQHVKFPSNSHGFDEDVNVYLAHLLFAVSLPEYHDMAEPYLSMDTSDIVNWVKSTEDRTIRYFIFKVNADHILVHTAIFNDLENSKQKLFKKSSKHYRELAQLYYDQAAIYHGRIYRKKTGVGDVLGKLSRQFESYQNLLKAVRKEYFNFVTGFRDQAFTHFMHDLTRYESEVHRQQEMDRLLDLYLEWLKTKNPETRKTILNLVDRIKLMDRDFQFDIDRGGYQDEKKCA